MKNYYSDKYFQARDILVPHLAQMIAILANENNLKKILDVGCGTGKYVKFFNQNGFTAIGCDNSPIAVKESRKINKDKQIFQASAVRLPFKKGSFDLLTGIHVVEHLTKNEAEEFIAETRRVLAPGGFIFLATPNFLSPLRLIQGKKWCGYRDPTHVNFYTPRSLARLLKSHGFINIRFQFKTQYHQSFNWEFPLIFSKFQKPFKIVFIFLFFSTPLALIRNGFLIAAQKK